MLAVEARARSRSPATSLVGGRSATSPMASKRATRVLPLSPPEFLQALPPANLDWKNSVPANPKTRWLHLNDTQRDGRSGDGS